MSRLLMFISLITILVAGCIPNATPAPAPVPGDQTSMPLPPTNPDQGTQVVPVDPNSSKNNSPVDNSMTQSPSDQHQPPYAPLPADDGWERGPVYIDSIQLLVMESYPVQIRLEVSGSLPTPCHKLRAVIQPPDADKRIMVEVYSIADPGAICIQVLHSFSEQISVGSYKGGHFTIWVNGEKVGEFDS